MKLTKAKRFSHTHKPVCDRGVWMQSDLLILDKVCLGVNEGIGSKKSLKNSCVEGLVLHAAVF
jgi:hypothetical protein